MKGRHKTMDTKINCKYCQSDKQPRLSRTVGAVDLTLSAEELNVCDEVWHELRPPRFYYGAQQLHR